MHFKSPLLKGQFVRRYKRFFADIEYQGKIITAHTPNTGSMKGCLYEGADCYFSFHDDPKRKLKYTLEILQTPTSLVGVNTGLPNKLVKEAFDNNEVPQWKNYTEGRLETKINEKTRIDLALWNHQGELTHLKKWDQKLIEKYKFHFIEVKNVTMANKDTALFPDSVTLRGQKHINELMDLVDKGHTCELVFTIQRSDVTQFSAAAEIDPVYAQLLKKAHEKGVLISPYLCDITPSAIKLNPQKKLPIIFN